MERTEILAERAKEIFHEKFPVSLAVIQEKYQKDRYRDIIRRQYEKMLELADKKEIAYFGISYLHSSLYDKSYEMLFSLLDKNFYLDMEPVEIYVALPFFFEQYEEDMEEIKAQIGEEAGHIQPYEENEIRRAYAFYYYAAIYKLFRDVSEEIEGIQDNITCFYGTYHGEAIRWQRT